MTHRKPNLPEKPCAACGRPFAWRKKWARDWDNVKTCSDRCKGELRRKSGVALAVQTVARETKKPSCSPAPAPRR